MEWVWLAGCCLCCRCLRDCNHPVDDHYFNWASSLLLSDWLLMSGGWKFLPMLQKSEGKPIRSLLFSYFVWQDWNEKGEFIIGLFALVPVGVEQDQKSHTFYLVHEISTHWVSSLRGQSLCQGKKAAVEPVVALSKALFLMSQKHIRLPFGPLEWSWLIIDRLVTTTVNHEWFDGIFGCSRASMGLNLASLSPLLIQLLPRVSVVVFWLLL